MCLSKILSAKPKFGIKLESYYNQFQSKCMINIKVGLAFGVPLTALLFIIAIGLN